MQNLFDKKYQAWKSGEIDDAELAVTFFVCTHLKKYPSKNLQKFLASGKSCLEALYQFRFKKIKEKAIFSLKMWAEKKWSFKLVDKVLTPYEVLSLQAKGIRPVSLIPQEIFTEIIHKEDCLEFFVHDLEHGFMFFHNDELMQMQLGFFQNVHESLASDIWSDIIKDKQKKERFFYLISDMNTHLEHYKAYLHAMIPLESQEKFGFLFSKN